MMDGSDPSWTEMLGRMSATSFESATGTVSYLDPDEDGKSRSGSVKFWYRRPESWRIEDEDGLLVLHVDDVNLIRDPERRMQHVREMVWAGAGDPRPMLGGPDGARIFTSSDDYSTPMGPAEQIEMLGRIAWRFVLAPPPHKKHPLAIVIDDQTGTILEWRSTGIDAYQTMTDFAPDASIDNDIFSYEGPTETEWADRQEHAEDMHRLAEEIDWPAPRYWPGGMRLRLLSADKTIGSFVGYLDVRDDRVLVARWPADTPMPETLDDKSSRLHLHLWSSDGWNWALAVSVPLNPDELDKVIASIPSMSWPPIDDSGQTKP